MFEDADQQRADGMLTEEEQRELREDFEESAAYVHAYFRAYFLGKLDMTFLFKLFTRSGRDASAGLSMTFFWVRISSYFTTKA